MPQFDHSKSFCYERARRGALLLAWGLFQKLIVADTMAIFVNRVWDNPARHTGGALALAACYFAIPIYCDFAGYSNMSIGSAKLLGIELTDNFKAPYFATTIQDFWRRWHISLSSWFRDYVYIPLGGSRCKWWRHKFNLLLTFILSGLWHGAGWNFLIWGAIHGLFIVTESALFSKKGHWGSFIGNLLDGCLFRQPSSLFVWHGSSFVQSVAAMLT